MLRHQNVSNYNEYLETLIDEIKEIADDCPKEEQESRLEEIITSVVDNALITYSSQFYIMENTRNENAYFDVTGDDSLNVTSYTDCIGQLAYYALEADLRNHPDFNFLLKD